MRTHILVLHLYQFSHRRIFRNTYKDISNIVNYCINNPVSIRVENTLYKEAEDGCLFVVDLAGSENAADSQFHDKEASL